MVVGEGVTADSVEIERVSSGEIDDRRVCFGDGVDVDWIMRLAVPTTGDPALDELEPVTDELDSLRPVVGREVAWGESGGLVAVGRAGALTGEGGPRRGDETAGGEVTFGGEGTRKGETI